MDLAWQLSAYIITKNRNSSSYRHPSSSYNSNCNTNPKKKSTWTARAIWIPILRPYFQIVSPFNGLRCRIPLTVICINRILVASLAQMSSAHNNANLTSFHEDHIDIVHSTLKDLRSSMQQSKATPPAVNQQPIEDDKKAMKGDKTSPIWMPRHHHNQHNTSRESLSSDHNPSKPLSVDDEEADTDLETDRLLGQQRLDDHGFYDEKVRLDPLIIADNY